MATSTTAKKSSPPPSSVNKDLSCLRCRKKKAKCSKTRPTCTRCARSNQPCEYPDAPPNLADLSQKVLALYDSLRELEGEFLEKCLHSDNNNNAIAPRSEEGEDGKDSVFASCIVHTPWSAKQFKQDEFLAPSTQEPAGWSMSFTENGLSIHVVARNGFEWNEFAKSLSHQLNRDFGSNYLPAHWDPDAEGYYEVADEDQAEELDEDEYLVTVPIFSSRSLLITPAHQEPIPPEISSNSMDTSASILQAHVPHMIQHLKERFKWLEEHHDEHDTASSHPMMLIHQLKPYLSLLTDSYKDRATINDASLFVFIMTTYVASINLLPSIPNVVTPPLPGQVWKDCIEYAITLLAELILTQGDQLMSFPIISCIVLISWVDHELASKNYLSNRFKTKALIQMGVRLLLLSSRTEHEPWQRLIASFICSDVYSTTFYSQQPQLRSPLLNVVWRPRIFSDADIVLLEAELMLFLGKVLSVLYHEHDITASRKVDVDDVLTLIRDIELFEQELPNWASWQTPSDKFNRNKTHFHLIHNITKTLLFRPFCTNLKETQEPNEEDFNQTFTKATFLDLSISATDRLSICIAELSKRKLHSTWIDAATLMIKDVSKRAYLMFSEDQEIIEKLTLIEDRTKRS
ncbi:hypothetical protein BD560DRAFT_63013 [Blakeslea trispora]|nr:hypothetical protein BD560DRAFT_63013 [Blakeslea trispora]